MTYNFNRYIGRILLQDKLLYNYEKRNFYEENKTKNIFIQVIMLF